MSRMFLTAISLFIFSGGIAAQDEDRVAQTNEITWFGLDASKLKVIGEDKSAQEIVNKYFTGWNAVVTSERDKYDIGKTFRKDVVHYNLSVVDRLNQQRDPSTVIGYESQIISEDELANHIASYNTDGSGVGLVFVLENFNKYQEVATMWVTFFDIESGRILLARKMSAKPGGFGFRNYWVRTVHEVLEDSKRQYKKWVK